jgi:hypothetical protein
MAVAFFSVTSCTTDSKPFMPSVKGKAGEVLIIMEKKIWKSKIGDRFREVLYEHIPGLPQPEPMFEPMQIPSKAFAQIYKPHRNIIKTVISSEIKKAKIEVSKDIWATPQLVISLSAPNKEEFLELFEESKTNILKHLLKAERDRLVSYYKKYEESYIREAIEKKHKISLNFPKGYKLDVNKDNFVWISHETPRTSQGIFVYYYEYRDTSDFSRDKLVEVRDSILKENVPGPVPGSYMATERRTPLYFKEFLRKEKYTAEIRGLWRTENEFLGGPFVSYSTVDEKRNRLITVEGYVYAGKLHKRNYMRKMEAILYTLKIID